jgi:hypothetical protein
MEMPGGSSSVSAETMTIYLFLRQKFAHLFTVYLRLCVVVLPTHLREIIETS